MPRDLDLLLSEVKDEATFIRFVAALADDYQEEKEIEAENPPSPYSSGALGWENGTIGAMLGAAAAWGSSSSRRFTAEQLHSGNPWRRCAHILYAGKFYE